MTASNFSLISCCVCALQPLPWGDSVLGFRYRPLPTINSRARAAVTDPKQSIC